MDGRVRVRITPTIDNEYKSRAVFDGEDGWPFVPSGPGLHGVSIEAARAMLADAEFYTDPSGPDETPPGIKRAYASLRDRLRSALARAEGQS